MRRPRPRPSTARLLVPALALALVLAACGDDDARSGSDQDGGPAARPGLLVGQAADGGTLTDTVVVVDPAGDDGREIPVTDLARGVAAGPDRAFYEQGATIVLVDAADGTVTDLGLRVGEVDLAYSASAVTGGGTTIAVLLAPTGEAAALVDLDDGTVTDLLAATGVGAVLGAEVTPDEAHVVLTSDQGVRVVPSAAPDDDRDLGGTAGELTDDGTRVLVSADDGITLVPVAGGEATVVSDEGGGALAAGDRVVLGRGDSVVLVEEDGGEPLATVPWSGEAPPIAVGAGVLVPTGAGPTWALLDAGDATVTDLDELTGLVPGFGGQPRRWVPFVQTDGQGGIGGRQVLAVDTTDGEVVTVVDLAAGSQVVGLPVVATAGPAALVTVTGPDGTTTLLADLDDGAVQELGQGLQGAAWPPTAVGSPGPTAGPACSSPPSTTSPPPTPSPTASPSPSGSPPEATPPVLVAGSALLTRNPATERGRTGPGGRPELSGWGRRWW